MNNKSLLNEKEAEVGSPQQPQDLINKAAQPEQLVEGKSSSEAADLQLKMEKAAEAFTVLVADFCAAKYKNKTRNRDFFCQFVANQISAGRIFGSRCSCTPSAVFLRLGGAWVRLSRDHVAKAFKSSKGTKYADNFLAFARSVCKERGRVGWVLPRLETEEQEAAK